MISNNIILLNLIVLMVIQQFEEYYKNPFDLLFYFKKINNKFQIDYMYFIHLYNLKKFKINQMIKFLKYIKEPLGYFK